MKMIKVLGYRSHLRTAAIRLPVFPYPVHTAANDSSHYDASLVYCATTVTGRPGSSEVPPNPLTRWDVSSTPANGTFLT